MFGIGRTIGATWQIMKDSGTVLKQDKELLLFPVLGLVTAVVVLLAGAFIALTLLFGGDFVTMIMEGTLMVEDDTVLLEGGLGGPVLVLVITYMLTTFAFTFFNAALVAGALERIRGGDPTIGSSLGAAGRRFFGLLGWAIIAATVSLIFSILRSRAQERGGVGGVIAAIGLSALIAIWEFITFFTVPVIIAEGGGPIGAIRRSVGIVRQTWGKQLVAGFGFGLFYFLAVIPGVLIGLLLFTLQPVVGIVAGFVLILIGTGLVHTLAAIFKAVLYNYAVGGTVAAPTKHHDAPVGQPQQEPQFKTFNADFLSNAYRKKN